MVELNLKMINCVLDATAETIETMMDLQIRRYGELIRNPEQDIKPPRITTMIGLMSKQGFVIKIILSSSVSAGVNMSSRFLGEEQKELNMDVVDSIKEIINIIAGAAAGNMSEYGLLLTLPVVLIGNDINMSKMSNELLVTPLFVPDCGRVTLSLSVCTN